MAWKLYGARYELLGPLHVGYHKVGNVQRTRYYIPARNVWGAVTERLTHGGFTAPGAPEGNYQRIGEWIKRHCAFSYFFVDDGTALHYPQYEADGLHYGRLSQVEFERRFLSAHVTTALDPGVASAADGTLHEVEHIASYDNQGQRTRVTGWLWLDDEALRYGESRWLTWLTELWTGGERRYGFGRLRGVLDLLEDAELFDGYGLDGGGVRPRITVANGRPLLAHTVVQGVQGRGVIEPVVGRETNGDSGTFGTELTRGLICWVPGSVLQQEYQLMVDEMGLWRAGS